ncbi:uncharacterized protein LOC141649878 [Silene latifolia]|uniref:uncharacterized protein LOC141649878 n=1 Tax=Silene latifolia TaxID=37657 RepID=UPI003D772A52
MTLKSCLRKECPLILCQVRDRRVEPQTAADIPVVGEFDDVFPEEIPELPPKRDVDFNREQVLKSLDLNIEDVRGQGYDNGSNMKGKHQGVRKRLLEVNPSALYMSCACHSLNLALCDMVHSCTRAVSFFGIVQRIYALFSGSSKRWKILRDNVPDFTLKFLSNTRWESRIKSVKAIRFQAPELRLALSLLYESRDSDAKSKSEAESLYNALGGFDFLLGMIIWYEILFFINKVSKKLQSKSMCIDTTMVHVEGIMSYFEKFRVDGFLSCMNIAKTIALDMDVEPTLPTGRRIIRKRHFDETNEEDEQNQSPEEVFRLEQNQSAQFCMSHNDK